MRLLALVGIGSVMLLQGAAFALQPPFDIFDFDENMEVRITKEMLNKEIIWRAKITPWSGSWFHIRDNHMIEGVIADHNKYFKDKNSADYKMTPFEKYGAFIEKKYADTYDFKTKDIIEWEYQHHTYRDRLEDKPFFLFQWFDWRGHCDGLAAASMLSWEPVRPVTHEGITFTPGDLKALLVEDHIKVATQFFGNRYKSQRNYEKSAKGKEEKKEAYEDIKPELFHRIMLFYIKQIGFPVAFDFNADAKVNNHPVYEFVMNIMPKYDKWRREIKNTFEVTTDIVYAGYGDEDSLGTNRSVETYYYDLVTNDNGLVIEGQWADERMLSFRLEQKRKYFIQEKHYQGIPGTRLCGYSRFNMSCNETRERFSSVSNHPDFAWIPYKNVDVLDGEEEGQNPFIKKKIVNELMQGSFDEIDYPY